MRVTHRLTALLRRIAESLKLADDAYARMGVDGSDVEVVENHAGFIECAGCKMFEDGFYGTWEESAMVAHLQDHKRAGHEVPSYVIPRLRGRG